MPSGGLRVWKTAAGLAGETALGILREIYPKPLRWHRYLATARDPEGSGLVTIYHPWESGTDNSPRWDAPLRAVEAGEMPPWDRWDSGTWTTPPSDPQTRCTPATPSW